MPALRLDKAVTMPSNTPREAPYSTAPIDRLFNTTATMSTTAIPLDNLSSTTFIGSTVAPLPFSPNITQQTGASTALDRAPGDTQNVLQTVGEGLGIVVGIIALVVGILQLRNEIRKRQRKGKYVKIQSNNPAGEAISL